MIALNEGRRFIAVVEIAEILVGRSAVLAGVAEGLQQAAVVRLLHGSGRRLAEIGVSGREVGELLEALRQRSDEFATIEQGRRHVRLGAIQQCHLFDEVEKPPAASAAHPLAWKDAGPPKRVPVARGTWRCTLADTADQEACKIRIVGADALLLRDALAAYRRRQGALAQALANLCGEEPPNPAATPLVDDSGKRRGRPAAASA